MSAGRKQRKESLELIGIKISPALKEGIDKESEALDIAPSTYARQLLMLGWRSRHEAPVAKNPREQLLIDRFNELPVSRQEDVVEMVEALYRKYFRDKLPIEDYEVGEKVFNNDSPVKKVDKK